MHISAHSGCCKFRGLVNVKPSAKMSTCHPKVNTVGDIVCGIETRDDLLKIRNLGKRSADEIMDGILRYQYSILPKERSIGGELQMSVSTDKLIPGVLPPKEEQSGIDFVKILDDFDPSGLSKEVLDVFAARNPFVTAYRQENPNYWYKGEVRIIPDEPAEKRLSYGRRSAEYDREELVAQVNKYILNP